LSHWPVRLRRLAGSIPWNQFLSSFNFQKYQLWFRLVDTAIPHLQDGEASCRKKRCPALSCALQVKDPAVCCPRCAATRQEELAARQQLSHAQRRKQRRLKNIRAKTGDDV
jgi:hypothetical protein